MFNFSAEIVQANLTGDPLEEGALGRQLSELVSSLGKFASR
ncbi:MAG: hypothetical protein AB1652_00625 [Bacillota bacterium]